MSFSRDSNHRPRESEAKKNLKFKQKVYGMIVLIRLLLAEITLVRHPRYCVATESFGCSLWILAQCPSP
jgi:hypothetical protein